MGPELQASPYALCLPGRVFPRPKTHMRLVQRTGKPLFSARCFVGFPGNASFGYARFQVGFGAAAGQTVTARTRVGFRGAASQNLHGSKSVFRPAHPVRFPAAQRQGWSDSSQPSAFSPGRRAGRQRAAVALSACHPPKTLYENMPFQEKPAMPGRTPSQAPASFVRIVRSSFDKSKTCRRSPQRSRNVRGLSGAAFFMAGRRPLCRPVVRKKTKSNFHVNIIRPVFVF